jgi:hypothetical protein
MALKQRLGHPIVLNKHDIVPCINKAWKGSFVDAARVKKATTDRGWNPLNRELELGEEVLRTKDLIPAASILNTDVDNVEANVDDALVANLIDRLNEKQDSKKKLQRNLERKRKRNNATSFMDDAKKVTSGKLVGAGRHDLGTDVLDNAIAIHNQQAKKEWETAKNKYDKDIARMKKVSDIRSRN